MADKFDSGADTPGAAAVRRVIADPRRLFTILLILGSIAISIGRAFAFLHVLFAIVFPVACILGYAAINVFSQHANSSRSQTADNCYFLGFLYFLVSLAATLMFLQAERISVGEVVRGFGTALITTIAGLATRIYLLQGGANLSENRERAEFELAQAVQRFKDQLVATTDLLNASQQVSSELLQSVVVSTSDALAESANACKVTLQEGVRHVRESLIAIRIPSDAFTEQLKPGIEDLRQAVTRLTAVVKAQTELTSSGTGALYSDLAALNERLTSLDHHLKSITEHAVESQRQVQGQLDKIAGELGQSAGRKGSLYGRLFGKQ